MKYFIDLKNKNTSILNGIEQKLLDTKNLIICAISRGDKKLFILKYDTNGLELFYIIPSDILSGYWGPIK